MRRDAFDVDIGQNSWLTRAQLARLAAALAPAGDGVVLDVGCGSGGPTLELARVTGRRVVGVDVSTQAVAAAALAGEEGGFGDRARFVVADGSGPLPFGDRSFAAILCIDCVNHLDDRAAVFRDWARLLVPGGRLAFTDALVVTGVLSSDEIAIRASIARQAMAAPGVNEDLLRRAGFGAVAAEDTTPELAVVAARRHDARHRHAAALAEVEGEQAFHLRQRFFALVAKLAAEGRLSRFAYVAERAPNAL